MTEHYTKNTETVTHWCKKCNRETTHRVDSGRLGPCLEHFTVSKARIPKLDLPEPPEQGDLFKK